MTPLENTLISNGAGADISRYQGKAVCKDSRIRGFKDIFTRTRGPLKPWPLLSRSSCSSMFRGGFLIHAERRKSKKRKCRNATEASGGKDGLTLLPKKSLVQIPRANDDLTAALRRTRFEMRRLFLFAPPGRLRRTLPWIPAVPQTAAGWAWMIASISVASSVSLSSSVLASVWRTAARSLMSFFARS